VSKEQPSCGKVEELSPDKLLICNTLYSSFEHAHIAQLARAREEGCYLIQSNLTQQKGKDFCSRRFFCSKNKEGCPYAVTYRFQNGQCRLANHNRLLQHPHKCERLTRDKCSERIRFYLNKYKDLLFQSNNVSSSGKSRESFLTFSLTSLLLQKAPKRFLSVPLILLPFRTMIWRQS